jgi:hypothetical protein
MVQDLFCTLCSGPAIVKYAIAKSSILAAIGPRTPTVLPRGYPPVVETRPVVGLSPYTPQNDDGIRIEPPPSEPNAIGEKPADTAPALPPDEPPHECNMLSFFLMLSRID